ncbi:fam-g protein [Plasmodium gallinaceum]|uniref:Fam-g protein n=1 Tax=Plasmodium gallinaceum TaxID=5849 RepID=A0A1J1GNM3_PLAGA|nr:fam-g protein [Plasmodium gallinaceum]CRG94079.1 fam-g protein [Plasmodium gallinaceum]
MKTFTLYLKFFIFLLLIWIFHCFYNYDSSKSLVNKDKLQTKIGLKHERTLAEVDISEKKSSYIDKHTEHYTSGDMDIRLDEMVYLIGMYFKCYNANIKKDHAIDAFFKEENKMIYKCRDKILNAYRNIILSLMELEAFNGLISIVLGMKKEKN